MWSAIRKRETPAVTRRSVGWSGLLALHDCVSQVQPPTDDKRSLIVVLKGCGRVE